MLMLTDCLAPLATEADKGQSQNTYKIGKMIKYFLDLQNIILDLAAIAWICKFVWNLQNNICGFNNFIKICNSFSDNFHKLFNDDFQKNITI